MLYGTLLATHIFNVSKRPVALHNGLAIGGHHLCGYFTGATRPGEILYWDCLVEMSVFQSVQRAWGGS
jgi:hypothetical protein